MQLTIEIPGTSFDVAETLRAIAIAIEDPEGVLVQKDDLDVAHLAIAKLERDVDDSQKKIEHLSDQLHQDVLIIRGLREQLAMRDSSAVGPTAPAPPVQGETAVEDVLLSKEGSGESRRRSPLVQAGVDESQRESGGDRRVTPIETTAQSFTSPCTNPADPPVPERQLFRKESHEHVFDAQLVCKTCGHCALDLTEEEKLEQDSRQDPRSDGQQVAGDDGVRITPEGPQAASPCGTHAQRPAEDRPVAPVGQRGSPEGGPPAPGAAANPFPEKPEKKVRRICKGVNKAAGVRCISEAKDGSEFCGKHRSGTQVALEKPAEVIGG